MTKGLVITHGNLGKELIAVAEKILEQKVDLDHISFDWQEDGSKAINKVEDYLKKNKGKNIVIFTDMFGGSPTNICFKFKRKNLEIITGINLPGLLKFLSHRKTAKFDELVAATKTGSIEGVNIISEYLGEKKG